MKQPILDTIASIMDLLTSYGFEDEARWFGDRKATLERETVDSSAFKSTLREIENILAGMGSFDDIPLNPPGNSGLTRHQARAKQTELADRLFNLIRDALQGKVPGA